MSYGSVLRKLLTVDMRAPGARQRHASTKDTRVIKIGIVKESINGETRVAGTPDIVKKYCGLGCEVQVAVGAGLAAGFTDDDYQAAGAASVDPVEAFSAEVVLKVRRPSSDEIELMHRGTALFGFLEPREDDGTLERLAQAGVNSLAMEQIPRISRAQSMDALSSQGNISGYRAVIEAGAHYARFLPMMMTAAGAARPARVMVLGAGVAGLQAIATARRLGAEVEAFDIRPEVKEQIESLGAKSIELDLGESGAGKGGYAKELSAQTQHRQKTALNEYLPLANVVISTAQIPGRPAPELITPQALKGFRRGSVIVDLAAASGGNCPLTEADRVVVKHGVILIGHTNYPAMMPGDASMFYARNLLNLLALLIDPDNGPRLKPFAADEITQAALVTFEGDVVHDNPQ